MRVLHTVNPSSDRGNPFVSLMIGALPPSIQSEYFEWSKVIFRRYDVVHFQWEEKFVVASRPAVGLVKRAAFRVMLRVLAARCTAIVVTVHNLAAHENPGMAAARALRELRRRAHLAILLNPADGLSDSSGDYRVIPHGNYRSVVPSHSLTPSSPRTLLYFGFIREYKNVPSLIGSFSDSRLPSLGFHLEVIGRPRTEALRADVEAAIKASPENIGATLHAVRDDELYQRIEDAGIVVLPYSQLYNSGAVLMALSMDRPVVVPTTATTQLLRERFGHAWVTTYDGSLTPDSLERAVLTLENAGPRPPLDLSDLDWELLGAKYESAYQHAVRLASR